MGEASVPPLADAIAQREGDCCPSDNILCSSLAEWIMNTV
jgi:hypothetical protein